MRIAVCRPQVPFVSGGAEVLTDSLVAEMRRRGHDATLVTIPFRWYPGARVLSQALLWRLVDLDEADGREIDLVIATKFPSYAVRHRRKIIWLVHQFRQAYDLDRTDLGQFGEGAFDRATRRAVHRLDRLALGEAQGLFAISSNVASRLEGSLGIKAEVLRPPPQDLDYRCEGYGDFILAVGRLDRAKRIDLLLASIASRPGLKIVIVGEGPDRQRLEVLARRGGARDGEVTFAGTVQPEALAALYARCLAVYYAPHDEDFGLVPLEAFRAEKPVVTTRDAGGPLEVVRDGENGLVCEPDGRSISAACHWLAAHPEKAREMGRAGLALVEGITWDYAISRLLAS
jgi:glycosyltransferase involved in cell wall biosynthesis